MNLAPVILFVYNRPAHTEQTIEHLWQNKEAPETDLIIYSDGAKNEAGTKKVNEVRAYIRKVTGFKSVTIFEQKNNFGLAKSIITGVTATMEKFGRAIVLEDDIIPGKFFLSYMNRGLERYVNDERVASVAGYNFPVGGNALPESFFLLGADCWGWGTWKRCWDLFEPDAGKLLRTVEARKLGNELDLDGAYSYTQMLRNQIEGKVNSWAIRWHTAVFLAGKLSLYPGKSIVRNIGFDGSGIHGGISDVFDTDDIDREIVSFPTRVSEDSEMRQRRIAFFKRIAAPQESRIRLFMKKMRNKLRDIL